MHQYALPAIILLGLILRIGYAVAIYEPSLLPYHYGDFTEYALAAEQIASGDLSFSNSYFLVRPPVFPLLIVALGVRPLLIVAVNIIIAIGIIPVTYALARKYSLNRNWSLLAALLLALDPTSVKYSGVMLAEPLANLLLALAFVSLVCLRRAESPSQILGLGVLSGALIALSALTRPAAFLLWIPMALWIALARARGWRLLAVVAFVLPAALGVGGWKLHNAVVFNNSAFSTIGTYNLLYFRAAMTHYWAHGREDINATYAELARRVEAKLGNDVPEIGPDRRWWHRANAPAQASAMTDVALEVFLEHPLEYAMTIPVGLYRFLFEVKIEVHGENQWGLPWWVGVIWNGGLLALAGFGCWSLARARKWADAAFLLLPCAYFLIGTLLVQTSGIDTRARVMVTPLLALLAAYGLMRILNRRKAASASPSPPADS